MTPEELKQRLLALLTHNARISTQEIADRLATDEATIQSMIAELENDHSIVGYTAILRDGAETDKVTAIIEIEAQPQRDTGYDTIAERIVKFPEVRSLYLESGHYDFRLEVCGRSLQEVASFVSNKLACLPGVKSTATFFLLKKYKEAGIELNSTDVYERLKITP